MVKLEPDRRATEMVVVGRRERYVHRTLSIAKLLGDSAVMGMDLTLRKTGERRGRWEEERETQRKNLERSLSSICELDSPLQWGTAATTLRHHGVPHQT